MGLLIFNGIKVNNIFTHSAIFIYMETINEGNGDIIHNDDMFTKEEIKMVEELFNKSYDFVSKKNILKAIQFCEKYDIPVLEKKLKKYFAKVIFPIFYDNVDKIYGLYNDPKSNNILSPEDSSVTAFLSKFSCLLV